MEEEEETEPPERRSRRPHVLSWRLNGYDLGDGRGVGGRMESTVARQGKRKKAADFFSQNGDDVDQFLAGMRAEAEVSSPGVPGPPSPQPGIVVVTGPPPSPAYTPHLPPFIPATKPGLGVQRPVGAMSPAAVARPPGSPPHPFERQQVKGVQVELGASPALRPRQEQLIQSGSPAPRPRQPCSLVGMAARAMEVVSQQPGRPALENQVVARVIDIGLEEAFPELQQTLVEVEQAGSTTRAVEERRTELQQTLVEVEQAGSTTRAGDGRRMELQLHHQGSAAYKRG